METDMAKQYATTIRAKQNNSLLNVSTTHLVNLLEAASEMIDRFCGREFDSSARTEYHDGDGSQYIYLHVFPNVSLTTVGVSSDYWVTETNVTTTALLVHDVDGRCILKHTAEIEVFPRGVQNVKVVYTAGYAAASIPEDIQQACCVMAGNMYAETGMATSNLPYESEKIGDWTYKRSTAGSGGGVDGSGGVLSPSVRRMLSPYAVHRF